MASPKRARFDNEQCIVIDSDGDLQKALEDVDACQQELETLQDKENEEIIKLEEKYTAEKRPIFIKREEAIRSIPNFWVTVLLNHPDLSTIIHESEEEYLSHLTQIEVQNVDGVLTGYKIIFNFKENPYFSNTVITKDYSNIETESDLPTSKISATPILWKEGHDISAKLKERKSFFWWLTSYEDRICDIDVAETIKDDLWVNPLQYYLVSDANDEQEENSDEGEEELDDVLILETDDEEGILTNQDDILEDADSDNTNDDNTLEVPSHGIDD